MQKISEETKEKINYLKDNLQSLSENIDVLKNQLNDNFKIDDEIVEQDNISNLEEEIKETKLEIEELKIDSNNSNN